MAKKLLPLMLAALLLLSSCANGDKKDDTLPPELDLPESEVIEVDPEPEETPPPDPEPMEMTLEEVQGLLAADESGAVPIETARQLAALSVLVRSGDTTHYDRTYVMQGDINISGMAFVPIGGGEYEEDMPRFGGTFDGGNYILSGLTVTAGVANPVGNGLFGAVGSGGSVSNLHLTTAEITGHKATGAVAGYCEGKLSNCSVAGTVTSTGESIGGLCGALLAGGEITGCFSNTETSGNTKAGGFIGVAAPDSRVANCHARGKVTSIDSPFTNGPARVGGFIGQNEGQISSCYSYMDVYTQVATRVVGGFIGYNDGALEGCYYNQASTSNWKDIDANADEEQYRVTGCTVEEMLEQDTYAGWDFENTWGMSDDRNRGLPHLRAAWE